ncbi:nuclear RNA polymerase D1B [Tasmannia lanceolata]|uniref:nuclear RNA polymerase D1B n=1 Tax=Tasmannia lanceolata TaxID=3420 RepID=UPI0040644360
MEESVLSPLITEGRIFNIRFGLCTFEEICTSSISDCPISHPSQLTNPFLGLPLESGKCESCGTSENGKCEGHFGYIELPIPIYHPSHVSELRHILSLLCLKCLKLKKGKVLHNQGNRRSRNSACSFCSDVPALSIKEVQTADGAVCLELKLPPKSRLPVGGFWSFLERYGFRYGSDTLCRSLLPFEALQILRNIPEETKKRLAGKGYFPQSGYILQCLPVPPNCLSVPDISDGTTIMSSDHSISMLRRVLNKVEVIKRSRSGSPNFESHEIEANDLQSAVGQYMHLRGTKKAPRDMTRTYGVGKEADYSSTKVWLEKMRTLFISKGSGFSSRSVITGDAYKGINEIGLPLEIAQKITFEEKVTEHNLKRLQEMVDNKLCLTYRDGPSTYAIREGSKGHTSLKVGQVVNRRIVDGDVVFINRPPSTHKHSLQAFSAYVHDDHTVKINPLICGPLGADFDGDCVHIFYPQSLAAKAEVQELFRVEQQLLSSHSGTLNIQLVHDSLLSLKVMFKTFFLNKKTAQQLAMFVSPALPQPALFKGHQSGPLWTVLQIVQSALPAFLECSGERHLIRQSELLKVDCSKDLLQSSFTEMITSIFSKMGPKEALKFCNLLQPLLMEILFLEGSSMGLNDFVIPKAMIDDLKKSVQDISPLLRHLRSNEVVEFQAENCLKSIKLPIVNCILKFSALGSLIDSKSDSAMSKLVQQVGFLGLQLFDRGKFYSRALFEDMSSYFLNKYFFHGGEPPCEAFGCIRSSFFEGLNPYEELVHSISSRELMIRSSRGLTEPGTLFKNLMAILRDVIICYDGTVRHMCSNSVIQFEYGDSRTNPASFAPAGEPVGVLAATAVSNPAYKAVLDSSQSNSSSWELMKEILLCKVNFKNDDIDRRVILYLNDCHCGKKYCMENTAYIVQNHLRRVTLKDFAIDFMIEYQNQRNLSENTEMDAGLVGHIHLDKMRLNGLNRSMLEILQECQEVINCHAKKKSPLSQVLKKICLFASDCCDIQQQYDGKLSQVPCLHFSYRDVHSSDDTIENVSQIMANAILPILLDTIVKGDPRVRTANIIWVDPNATSWVRNPCKRRKGELALEVVIEKDVVKQRGDAWRIVLDSCLPILHLLDPKRSIPYGVQQIQELLGISCAFDESVQRLSTAMRTVSKGLLKEHLLLVANSMACTGNLFGFNAGGYKALFRSLKIQVPFTEATLFTPKKCFERAAEKSHMDSLSSTVSSCSWGKHVAIGTGTRFEILWNKKGMEANEDIRTDAYSFLHLVRPSSNKSEVSTACLGAEVDDLEEEDGNMELTFSPEQNLGSEKPTFDDGDEFEFNPDGNFSKSTKEEVENSAVKSDVWGGWTNDKQLDSDKNAIPISKPSVWSSWDTDKTPTHSDSGNAWGGWKSSNAEAETARAVQSNDSNGWDKNAKQAMEAPPEKSTVNFQNQPKHGHSPTESNPSNPWGVWKSSNAEAETARAVQSNDSNGWDKNAKQAMVGPPEKSLVNFQNQPKHGHSPTESNPSNPWGVWKSSNAEAETAQADQSNDSNSWDKNEKQAMAGPPEKLPINFQSQPQDPSNPWGSWKSSNAEFEGFQAGESDDKNRWDKNATQTLEGRREKSPINFQSQDKWSPSLPKLDPWGSQSSNRISTGESVDQISLDQANHNVWNKNYVQGEKDPDESPMKSLVWDTSEAQNLDGLSNPSPSFAKTKVWGSQSSNETHNDSSSDMGFSNEKRPQDPSNRPKRAAWGSWNTANGKNQNNRSNPPLDGQNGRATGGSFTSTGKRLDLFTSEEEKVISDVEPIMLSIRRILHQSSYGDGERLSDEDQSYVLDNVFGYHPNKTAKVSDKIDYFMVDKHRDFAGSRCLFVASTNGLVEDFSYIKCMENYVKEKYPETAESFNKKYFRKRRPEGTS